MINSLFFGKIDASGKILLEKNDQWKLRLETLKDQDIQISIDRKRKRRSTKQNSYLWGAVYETIASSTGHTPTELHHIFGAMFLKRPIIFNGKEIIQIKSTTELSTGEMVEYIMNIAAEVATMGITLPDSTEWDPVKYI